MDLQKMAERTGSAGQRNCTRCLLRDLAEEDQRGLKKYLAVIKEPDRADPETYETRLQVCLSCEKLNNATCEVCGCYVEFRAYVKNARCPKRKW